MAILPPPGGDRFDVDRLWRPVRRYATFRPVHDSRPASRHHTPGRAARGPGRMRGAPAAIPYRIAGRSPVCPSRGLFPFALTSGLVLEVVNGGTGILGKLPEARGP